MYDTGRLLPACARTQSRVCLCFLWYRRASRRRRCYLKAVTSLRLTRFEQGAYQCEDIHGWVGVLHISQVVAD